MPCVELLSLGLAARPLHARGHRGESAAPVLPPWAPLALRGFVPELFTYLGTALELLQSQKSSSWYFQFVFLREDADVIGCSRSPSVASGFYLIFSFSWNLSRVEVSNILNSCAFRGKSASG